MIMTDGLPFHVVICLENSYIIYSQIYSLYYIISHYNTRILRKQGLLMIIISQKMIMIIVTAVETSNLTRTLDIADWTNTVSLALR
jgi:hypothetical protein